MINGNSLHSVVFALILFVAIYFAALGIYELTKWISKKRNKNKKEDE